MSYELNNEIPEALNDEEIANFLGVSKATVKAWAELVGINGNENGKSERRYDSQSIKILETVKKLRENDKGYNTIIRLLKNNNSQSENAVNSKISIQTDAIKQNDKELYDFFENNSNYTLNEDLITSFKETEKNIQGILHEIGKFDNFEPQIHEQGTSNLDIKAFKDEVEQNTAAITRLHGCVQDLEERFQKLHNILKDINGHLKEVLSQNKEMENRMNFFSDKCSLLEKNIIKRDEIETRFSQINLDNVEMKRDLLLLKTINSQLIEKDAKIENHLLTMEQKKNIEKNRLSTLKNIVDDLYTSDNICVKQEFNNRFISKEAQDSNEWVVEERPHVNSKNKPSKNSYDETTFNVMRLEEKLKLKEEKITLLENHIKVMAEPRGFWAKLKKFLLQV